MHPTPLRVDKIGAILSVGISKNAFSIYQYGAGDGHTVGPPQGNLVAFRIFSVLQYCPYIPTLIKGANYANVYL